MLTITATLNPHQTRRIRRLRQRAHRERRRFTDAHHRSLEAEIRIDPARIRAGQSLYTRAA